MNFISIFKIAASALVIIIFMVSTFVLMSNSYAEYMEYYNSAMAEKEYEKYLETLPLSFDGVSISLNDGVNYYATGKAAPSKNDFTVLAHFSEKGKSFDKILSPSEYELNIPEDFAVNGGTITARYLYQPEKEADSEVDPEPIVRTANIKIVLSPVVLTALEVVETPYRVYYSDSMSFDAEGIKLKASFNYGEPVILGAADVKVLTSGTLTAGTMGARVSYTVADVTLETEIPITVTGVADYTEGDIVSIATEGELFLNEGDYLTDAVPTVRATYANGNRLIISSDKYTVGGGIEKASFYNNCIVSVSLNSDPKVTCKAAATVRFVAEAEGTTSVGGVKKTVVTADGKTVTVMQGYSNSNSLNFVINSSSIVKGDLSIRVANLTGLDLRLADVMTVKVNGRQIFVPYSAVLSANENSENYKLVDIYLPEVVLNKGSNTIVFSFDNISSELFAIDKINLETKYYGAVFENVNDYLILNVENGTEPQLDVQKVKDFHTVANGTYIHGICTDGSYIYAIRTTYSSGWRSAIVTKHDVDTMEIVATSPLTASFIKESHAGITYYDGKIIVYYGDGTEWCIDSSLAGEWTEYTGFDFEGIEGLTIRDLYYNDTAKKYAVLVSNDITIYDADKSKITSLVLQEESGGNLMRMSANDDVIYLLYSRDGAYQPILHLYDWDGNYIGSAVVPNGASVVGSELNFAKTNVQGMAVVNDSLYFSFLRFAQSNVEDAVAILKADCPDLNGALSCKLTIGELVAAGADKGLTVKTDAKPALDDKGRIETGGVLAMGGASDGEYLYLSVNGKSNLDTVISKVDPITHKVVGKTITFIPANTDGDNSKVFIKDGILYCIIRDGSMYQIALDDFNGEGCFVTKSSLSFAEYGTAISASWNDSVNKFAVVTNDKKLHILNEDLSGYNTHISLQNGSSWPSSITSDDKYIYVSYKESNTVPVDVYTWGGEKVGSFNIAGFHMGNDVAFNVQAIFFHNGELHATVCSWNKYHTAYFDWVVTFDQNAIN